MPQVDLNVAERREGFEETPNKDFFNGWASGLLKPDCQGQPCWQKYLNLMWHFSSNIGSDTTNGFIRESKILKLKLRLIG